MKPAEHLRLLVQNRPDLLAALDQQLCSAGTGACLVDPDGETIWASGTAETAGQPALRHPVEPYGEMRIWGEQASEEWAGIAASLLTACAESEAELNQLVDDHISTTNQLMALYNIVYGTHGTWDLAQKLDVIVREAGKQSNSEFAVLGQVGDACSPLHLYARRGTVNAGTARTLLDSVSREKNAHIGVAPESFVAAPILLHGEVYGWLAVTDREEGYLGRDLKLVQALADLAAGFLLTARLQEKVVETFKIGRELELASEIQELLIPRELPTVPGIEICAICHPASQVGGDFYAIQTLPDGDLVFAVGDVTGKGVPAAMLMAMTRTAFHSIVPIEESPGKILAHLNEVLCGDLERVGKFVTLVVGRYSSWSRNVILANAGHSPVLSISGHGAVPAMLEPVLPPIGVLPSIAPEEISVTLRADSVLVITSDGVTEARNPEGEFFGLDRLVGVFEAGTRATAAELAHRLLGDLHEFSNGAKQSDDQTLLILKGTR